VSLCGDKWLFGDRSSTSGTYRSIFTILILTGFQRVVMNVGKNGPGAHDVILDLGNDRVGIHDVTMDVRDIVASV